MEVGTDDPEIPLPSFKSNLGGMYIMMQCTVPSSALCHVCTTYYHQAVTQRVHSAYTARYVARCLGLEIQWQSYKPQAAVATRIKKRPTTFRVRQKTGPKPATVDEEDGPEPLLNNYIYRAGSKKMTKLSNFRGVDHIL